MLDTDQQWNQPSLLSVVYPGLLFWK